MQSTIIEDRPQKDGRRAVREKHVTDDGSEFFVDYLAEPKADVEEMLPVRAALIEQQLADADAWIEVEVVLEKARAVELLKLSDESLAAILKQPLEKVADEKAVLEAAAAKGGK